MLHRLLALACAAALSACATPAPPPLAGTTVEQRQPVTILVSIDGFSPDYLNKGDSPTLDQLAAEGVRAAMRPSFPSKTFPNHYTLVTGMRPDHHGITGNAMVDAARPGEMFTLGNAKQSQDPFWWDQAEPIWVTAEKQGVRTGTMFWPGADVPIHDTYPADWVRYYEPFSADQRVRTVIDWLRRPVAERPRLLTLYFEDVDTKGHRFGPGSPELKEAVRSVDKALADLIARTEALGQPLNLVIVSDHGMAATHSDRAVDLDTLVPRDAYLLINAGAIVELNPLPGREAEVSRALVKKHPHFECWNKADIPSRFAYGKNPRVPAIVCLTETGWEVWQGPPRWQGAGGDHGFDPADPAMRALFIANGPAFVRGTTLPDFDNIHVYPLLARVAGVAPLASDGDAGVLAGALVAR